MANPSKSVLDFMKKYAVQRDEIWEVHGSTWVVKHKALERVAAEQGIQWDKPELKVCDMAAGIVAVLIGGKLGDHVEFSFGEASPKNNKNSYPLAMAEKRAKDRVILKLLAAHGDLYSEEEADDFKQRQNPHVTRPEDIVPTSDEEILPDVTGVEKLTVDAQRPIFEELQGTLWKCGTEAEMKRWITASKAKAARLSESWKTTLNGLYIEHRDSIRQQEAADNRRMVS